MTAIDVSFIPVKKQKDIKNFVIEAQKQNLVKSVQYAEDGGLESITIHNEEAIKALGELFNEMSLRDFQ